jgi:hypothetical protein
VGLQFRAEFFNIFNHTNLALPSSTGGGAQLFVGGGARTGSAGQITSMVGTPRQIQFALKMTFLRKARESIFSQSNAFRQQRRFAPAQIREDLDAQAKAGLQPLS